MIFLSKLGFRSESSLSPGLQIGGKSKTNVVSSSVETFCIDFSEQFSTHGIFQMLIFHPCHHAGTSLIRRAEQSKIKQNRGMKKILGRWQTQRCCPYRSCLRNGWVNFWIHLGVQWLWSHGLLMKLSLHPFAHSLGTDSFNFYTASFLLEWATSCSHLVMRIKLDHSK